jgi:hypothetical protein
MNHFERDFARARIQHIVLVNCDVLEPLLAPLVGDPERKFVIPLRAGRMRFGSEIAMERPDLVR